MENVKQLRAHLDRASVELYDIKRLTRLGSLIVPWSQYPAAKLTKGEEGWSSVRL